MRKSTNFNLNLVEGNDLVNPLVQDVPNYEAIDEQMYKNECNSIGNATELKSGTVHALTRRIPNASMFRFQATSNFTAGDTFTVDGIQVSALTPNGETLASGCYIIGSEVLCVLRETLLTVYVSGGTVTTAQDSEKLGGELPSYYATSEALDNVNVTAQASNRVALSVQEDVDARLNVEGTPFYFDRKDGVFGFNTVPTRGADTFHPFSGDSQKLALFLGNYYTNSSWNRTINTDFFELVSSSAYSQLAVKAKKNFEAIVYSTCMGAGVNEGFQYRAGTFIDKHTVTYSKNTTYTIGIGINPAAGSGASMAIVAV